MPGPKGDDLALLTDAARAAGDIARRYFKSDPQIWDKSDGQGPVTQADLEIDAMLKSRLQSARRDYGWLSEETDDDPTRLTQSQVFIVDPIDGTRAFIEGSAHWSHSLAIAQNGQITAAAVYLPMLDRMFTAQANGGAYLNGSPIQVSGRNDADGATILAHKANFQAHHWPGPGGMPNMKRAFRSSLAYRLCLVAQGRPHSWSLTTISNPANMLATGCNARNGFASLW
ncbi:MAG: 3'(2'),5'-bisphosphate nucleotidase CysQ [Pseudomonadota bacterium]